jgi:dolichyl-phosphate beta-glucosyltransferase
LLGLIFELGIIAMEIIDSLTINMHGLGAIKDAECLMQCLRRKAIDSALQSSTKDNDESDC